MTRFCKDCKHHRVEDFGSLPEPWVQNADVCYGNVVKQATMSLVTGEMLPPVIKIDLCETARMFTCGPKGHRFEEKDA